MYRLYVPVVYVQTVYTSGICTDCIYQWYMNRLYVPVIYMY